MGSHNHYHLSDQQTLAQLRAIRDKLDVMIGLLQHPKTPPTQDQAVMNKIYDIGAGIVAKVAAVSKT